MAGCEGAYSLKEEVLITRTERERKRKLRAIADDGGNRQGRQGHIIQWA